MKVWNHWHQETHKTMKPLTPRNLWNHETHETMKPLTPRNLWNHVSIDTTKHMKPWLHDTIIIWHRHWHILISINSCTVTPSNNPISWLRWDIWKIWYCRRLYILIIHILLLGKYHIYFRKCHNSVPSIRSFIARARRVEPHIAWEKNRLLFIFKSGRS